MKLENDRMKNMDGLMIVLISIAKYTVAVILSDFIFIKLNTKVKVVLNTCNCI